MNDELQRLKSKLEEIEGVDVVQKDENEIEVSLVSDTYSVYVDDDTIYYHDTIKEQETEVEPFIEFMKKEVELA